MTPEPETGAAAPVDKPMIHEGLTRDLPWATKYSRTGCETGRTYTGSKTKTFSWPDPKSSSGMQVVTVTVAAAYPTGSLYRNISLKRDTPPGDFGDFPLEVLKDIVEWAYARETTTLAQRVVAKMAADLGMTETGKSEHRVYSSQPSMQNIPRPAFGEIPLGKPEVCTLTELGPMDAAFAALKAENLPNNDIPEWQRTDTPVPLYDQYPEPVAKEVRAIGNTIGWNSAEEVRRHAEARMKELGLEMPKPVTGT